MMVDAASAPAPKRIVAVMPCFGGRPAAGPQGQARVSIGAKLVGQHAHRRQRDRIMTMDLHADRIQGFFEVPVDHLFASSIFVPYVRAEPAEPA